MAEPEKEMERSTSPVKKPRRPIRQTKRKISVSYELVKKRGKKEPKQEIPRDPKPRKSFDHPIFDGLGTPDSSPKDEKGPDKKKEQPEIKNNHDEIIDAPTDENEPGDADGVASYGLEEEDDRIS